MAPLLFMHTAEAEGNILRLTLVVTVVFGRQREEQLEQSLLAMERLLGNDASAVTNVEATDEIEFLLIRGGTEVDLVDMTQPNDGSKLCPIEVSDEPKSLLH